MSDPGGRPRAVDLLDQWAADPQRGAPFVAQRRQAAQAGRQGPTPPWLPAELTRALAAQGIDALYQHQLDALEALRRGEHVVVATPTASGKSVVYTLPILAALISDPEARALIICPTKALAHDQAAAFNALAERCGLMVAAETYDGDTPRDRRRHVRDHARVILTNPDMLHSGILPRHDRWRQLFAGLRYVVLDESHVYRGVFGSHVANVLRRLRRITAFHGVDPRCVLCSATLANPQAHGEALIEAPLTAVTASTAPSPGRALYVYRPPVVDAHTGLRGSYIQATRRVVMRLHEAEIPTIVFADSRARVEQLVRQLKADALEMGLDPAQITGYRGGYLPELRRAVERGLRAGQIRTVVSTSALELGVDIGQLEACVLAGYPGTVASALQRAGRAGRGDTPAAVVLVARSAPVDQYIAHHPEFFFEGSPEGARLDADNLLILADHLKCATFELPFERGAAFGRCPPEDVEEILGFFADQRVIYAGARRYQWTGEDYPARGINLRRMADGAVTVIDPTGEGATLGEVEFHQAPATLHPGAIYTVNGRTYEIHRLDLHGRRAEARPVSVDWYTEATADRRIAVLDAHAERPLGAGALARGEIRLVEQITGFRRIHVATGEGLGYGEIHLDPRTLHTAALWLRPSATPSRLAPLTPAAVPEALAGLAAALRTAAAVILMCDPGDLGVEATSPADLQAAPDGPPWIFLYERQPGGVGLTDALYELGDEALIAAEDLLARCPCEDGCPACTGGPDRSRQHALQILRLFAA